MSYLARNNRVATNFALFLRARMRKTRLARFLSEGSIGF
jgi:hypothetical protein